MAVARLVCGDCGGALTPSAVRCPSCGASIERESAPPASRSASREEAPPAPSAPVLCPSCGGANSPGAEFCSSCGSRLGAAAPAPRAGRDRPPRRQEPRRAKSSRGLDAWQIVSIIAVAGFLSYWIYLKVTEHPPAAAGPPPAASEGGSPMATFNGQSVDLSPLEEAVRARPADPEARLRLANALSDTKAFPRAVEAYKAYLAIRPKDPNARTDLGICYFQEALTDSLNRGTLLHDAASEMETAFTTSPRPHQPSAFNLGVVYIHLNQVAEANKWFRKAYEIDKDSELGKKAQTMIAQTIIPQ